MLANQWIVKQASPKRRLHGRGREDALSNKVGELVFIMTRDRSACRISNRVQKREERTPLPSPQGPNELFDQSEKKGLSVACAFSLSRLLVSTLASPGLSHTAQPESHQPLRLNHIVTEENQRGG